MKKAQAALEFLTTYGWVFLVIVITLSALYSSGILDFGKYLPNKCQFSSQMPCLDFTMDGANGEIRILLQNNFAEEINITYDGFNITSDDEEPVICDPYADPIDHSWKAGEQRDMNLTNCAGGTFLSGERINLKASVTYYSVITPSHPNHTISGRISGTVR